MSNDSRDPPGAGRRNFLKGVTLTGAAALKNTPLLNQ